MESGVEIGGWCPRGRLAEDGIIPTSYSLDETPSEDTDQRTLWNVRDSDGTLVLGSVDASGGTRLTVRAATELGRPVLVTRPDVEEIPHVRQWIEAALIRTLNIAGPRESESPGIYEQAHHFVRALLSQNDYGT